MTLGPYLAQSDEHQRLAWIGDSTLQILVDSAVTEGRALVMRAETTNGSGSPIHVHDGEDEIFILLEGTITVWVGNERREMAAGAVAFLPRHIPHAYVVTSRRAAILEVITPGGIEAAFREAGWDTRQPIPPGWSCTPAAVGQAMAKLGCRILGPPPSADDGPLTESGHYTARDDPAGGTS